MANPAVNTAVCQCTFGAAPAPLTVTSQNTVTGCQYARGNDNGYTQAANDFRHVQQPCESYGGKRHPPQRWECSLQCPACLPALLRGRRGRRLCSCAESRC